MSVHTYVTKKISKYIVLIGINLTNAKVPYFLFHYYIKVEHQIQSTKYQILFNPLCDRAFPFVQLKIHVLLCLSQGLLYILLLFLFLFCLVKLFCCFDRHCFRRKTQMCWKIKPCRVLSISSWMMYCLKKKILFYQGKFWKSSSTMELLG